MKKIITSLVLIIISVIVIRILIDKNNKNTPISDNVTTEEKKVVNILHRWPSSTDIMGNILSEFEKIDENIKIELDSVPSSMYEAQLNVRLVSDYKPDIYFLWPGGRTEIQRRNGYILDISDLWEENGWYDSFTTTAVVGSTHTDGKMYTLPIEVKPNLFWYNVKIFEEVGAEVPTTWDELMEVAKLCKDAGYTPFALGGNLTRWMPAFWFDYLLLNTAGGEFREDLMWGKESWESEEVYRVFEMWKEVVDNGYYNEDFYLIDSKQAIGLVGSGEAAMMLQGPWAITDLMNEEIGMIPEKDFNFFPFPVIDESMPKVTEGSILSLAINPKGDATEDAKELLKKIADKESITNLSQKRVTLGPRKDIGFEIYPEETREILKQMNEINNKYPLYMNFELATLPTVQDAGMNGFIEFLKSPNDYKDICSKIEEVSRNTFDK